ncbi:hypothetical protein [Maribacter sp. 2210JD10-5]|uniref:hypothetical protein n=1 Tax=Maribacter sp. 2210JD10-5 TaxID=3386272 RepID=UPI0039BCA0EE
MKQTIYIPETLSDLTLNQYQRFLNVAQINEDEVFIQKKMIQIFCNVPLLDVEKMQKKDFDEIIGILKKMLEETPELTKRFTLKGIEYGFIPDFDAISFGEFVDLDNLTGNWDEMVMLMSILYRPIKKKKGKKYRIKPYKAEKNEAFSDLPLDIVIGSQLFFWHLGNKLLSHTKNYGSKALQTPKIQQELAKISDNAGAGTLQFQNSLDTISQILTKSLNQNFLLPYTI